MWCLGPVIFLFYKKQFSVQGYINMWCMGYKPVSCHVWLVQLGKFINSDLSFFLVTVMSQLMSSLSATLSNYGVTISHFAFSGIKFY